MGWANHRTLMELQVAARGMGWANHWKLMEP
jgi:hypothetical protein